MGSSMNTKQLKAKRRRTRQKLNKSQHSPHSQHSQPAKPTQTRPLSDCHPFLNKRVSFDHFSLDSNGVTLKPVHGIVIKTAPSEQEEFLTIQLIDGGEASTVSRRVEALMSNSSSSSSSLITATPSSLINFKLA